MKSLLLYNLYPKGPWKDLTIGLLANPSHSDIAVNVSMDWPRDFLRRRGTIRFLRQITGVRTVVVSHNDRAIGEAIGFENLRRELDFVPYDVVTYTHSKGVTKPGNENIADWIELMRYFVLERHDLCLNAFAKGYALYGVNLGVYTAGTERYGPYKFSDFHFSGNFVSVNLNLLREQFRRTPCARDYFGVEGFWGRLGSVDLAYCPHSSYPAIQSHYEQPYPETLYKPGAAELDVVAPLPIRDR